MDQETGAGLDSIIVCSLHFMICSSAMADVFNTLEYQ